ncbi:hypothetical protein [Candidatus Kuenenia sp.]|uniref:glycosyltransferase family 9 protein n=1 Tax=Candidatus Kuenenia sp. TaxID=2499824 RepID=UPI00321FE35C
MNKCKRILLGQLAARGDCLYATTISHQIKVDYPKCHLTWAIGTMCSSILIGNPYVDEIWEIPIVNHEDVYEAWQRFETEASERKKKGDFDEVFLTQIFPNNFQNFDGSVRSSLFRGYPNPITVPISPVLRLLPSEVEKVRYFSESNHIQAYKNVILFEYSSKSGQSFVTPYFALEVAHSLIRKFQDMCVILSSDIPIQSNNERIIDGSVLSFRENAELTKYCTLLIGCSSGISWLSTSDWAKPLKMVQLLKKDKSIYGSFIYDFKYYNISTKEIIEITDCPVERVVNCIETIITKGFSEARLLFSENIPLTFESYKQIHLNFILGYKIKKSIILLLSNIERHGFHWQIIKITFRNIIAFSIHKLSKIIK